MTQQPGVAALLHQEHLDTLSVINELEARLSGAGAKSPIDGRHAADATLVNAMTAMIANDRDRHFPFEEERLFPALEPFGFGEITAMLRDEHDVIRRLGDEVQGLADRAVLGPLDASAWKTFRALVVDLINIEMFHIQKEEMGLISRLPLLLDPATSAALGNDYGAPHR